MDIRRSVATVVALSGLIALAAPAAGSPARPAAIPPLEKADEPITLPQGGLFGDVAIEGTKTSFLVWKDTVDRTALVVCTLPFGQRACSHTARLVYLASHTTFDRPLVFVPALGTVQVLVYTCCHTVNSVEQPGTILFTSTDDGATFGAGKPVADGDLPIYDGAVVGGRIAISSYGDHRGTLVQSVDPTGASVEPKTTYAVASSDKVFSSIAALPDASVLVANEDFATGQPYTVHVEHAAAGAAFDATASYTTVATLPGESTPKVASGGGKTYLFTLADPQNLEHPVMHVRAWNGTAFDAPSTVALVGPGDEGHVTFAVDPSGRLYAFYISAREGYRIREMTSSNGGASWTSRLLGAAVATGDMRVAFRADGVGMLIATPAGGANPVIAQPILIPQKITATVNHSSAKPGTTVKITGKVLPAVTGHPVTIQRAGKHGTWTTIATVHEAVGGAFSYAVKAPQTGAISLRAVTPVVAGVAERAVSPTRALRAKLS